MAAADIDRRCACGRDPEDYAGCTKEICLRKGSAVIGAEDAAYSGQTAWATYTLPEGRFAYLGHLEAVAQAGNAVIRSKTETYADSWKARGGRGAWYTLVRPLDRLVNMVENQHQGDVFAAITAGQEGGDGTALDALRDLRNYLNLVEAEMVARGVVKL